MKKTLTLLFLSLMLGVLRSWAIPANPQPIEMTQPDGSVITIKMIGDEFGHYDLTEDGIPVMKGADGFFRYAELSTAGEPQAGAVIARNVNMRSDADKAYLEKLPEQKLFIQKFETRRSAVKQKAQIDIEPQAVQATGTRRGVVLLVQFTDEKFTYTNADFNNMMNQEGYNYEGAIGSVRDYYIAQSNGKFTPIFDVYGPFTMSNNEAYYGGDGSNGSHDPNFSERLPSDACDAANGSVDFSQYDADGDGYVDLLYIIYAGYSQSSSGNANDIWPKSGTASTGTFDKWDGKKISRYACSSELKGSSGTTRDGIGTFIHEYSHTLGLPDFYDTVSGATYGMGYWDMMCYGGYRGKWGVGYTAYERSFCGWMNLETLPSTGATLSLENLADSHTAYKMTSSDSNQYFILENRQKTGWDEYLPGAGLMITKVDYDASIWAPYGAVGTANRVNVDPNRQRMTIVPADNQLTIASEAGDLYPYAGNNSFTKNSSPASITNTGEALNTPIANIMQRNGLISFEVNGGGPLVTPIISKFVYAGKQLVIEWNAIGAALSYLIEIYRNDKPNEFWYQTNTGTTATSYYLSMDEEDENYTYTVKVKAIGANFESEFSASKSLYVTTPSYAINFAQSANGSFGILNNGEAITSGTMIKEGTTLTIETTPDTGYKVDAITINGEALVGKSFTVHGTTNVVVTFVRAETGYIEYCIPPTGSYNYSAYSYINTITFNTEDGEPYVLNLHPSETHSAYLDFTEEAPFNVDAGATISNVISCYAHMSGLNTGYLYVDWGKNGEFTQVSSNNGEGIDKKNLSDFQVPANAHGTYRARFQVDWADTDPCILTNIGANYKYASITADFIINVQSDVPTQSYAVNFGSAEKGTFRVLNNGTAITSGSMVLSGTTLTVETTPNAGYELDAITVNGSKITGNTFVVSGATTVAVTFKEEEEVVAQYSIPSGTMHSNGKTYVERIYTEGADTNIDKTWSSAPANVYQLVNDVVKVKPGSTFNLHLNAHSEGSESSTAVCQDLRYTTAVIFSDWNRDCEFVQEEVYGSNPPAHNVTGNMAVMEINKAFTVPTNASLGESRIRVIYSNAWGDVATANTTSIQEGMAYDIVVKVENPSAIDEMENENKVYAYAGKIVVKCNGVQPVEIINLTGQVVRSTTVNGNATFEVPTRGIYIVRCGAKASRVVVR